MFNTKPSLSFPICILSPKKISIVSKSPNSENPPKIKMTEKRNNQHNWGGEIKLQTNGLTKRTLKNG